MSEWEFKVCLRVAIQIAVVYHKKRTFQRCFNRQEPCEKNLKNPVAQLRPPWEGLARVRRLTQRASPWMNRKAFYKLWRENFLRYNFSLDTHKRLTRTREKIHWSGCGETTTTIARVYKLNISTHVPDFWARFPLIVCGFSRIFHLVDCRMNATWCGLWPLVS